MATKSRQKDALAVDRPEVFLKRERAAQRAGVVILILFVLAGAGGFFGNGPLSEATLSEGGVTITFERFTRQTLRTALEISVAAASEGSPVDIRISRDFLSAVDVLEMRPPSALQRLDAAAAIFEVPVSDGHAVLELHYEPKHFGVLRADIAAGNQPPTHIRQLVFF